VTPPTIVQFRSDFAEFADTSKYPDSQVTMWLGVAVLTVQNEARWGTPLLFTAQELVTAHYLLLAARDRAAAASGGSLSGLPIGLVTSESAENLSTSYDVTALLLKDAGLWNQTSYGQRYWTFARMVGAGGIQLPC
jgi:hypothetical protein